MILDFMNHVSGRLSRILYHVNGIISITRLKASMFGTLSDVTNIDYQLKWGKGIKDRTHIWYMVREIVAVSSTFKMSLIP